MPLGFDSPSQDATEPSTGSTHPSTLQGARVRLQLDDRPAEVPRVAVVCCALSEILRMENRLSRPSDFGAKGWGFACRLVHLPIERET